MKICPRCNLAYPPDIDECPTDQTPLLEAEEWPEGAVIGGKSEIVAKIGQDIACTIYKALQLKGKQFRVLKAVNNHLASNPDFVKLFKRGAGQLMKFQHANVAQVEGMAKTPSGIPFMVMEYVEGGSLQEIYGRKPRWCPCVPVPSPNKSLPDWRRGTPEA